LWARVTPEVVKRYFAHLVDGAVERYHLPGIDAINFVLHDALDGGGTASRRIDPLGKGMAQMLLDLKVRVPADMAATSTASETDVEPHDAKPRVPEPHR
ncbi:MAG: hypothetical protein ABI156_04140, partial [Caldimonas sp.]